MINAYFSCVNANGGVNGHPLKLFVELDQTNPAQITAAAKQLIQSDHVVAIDGVFDLLECTLDASYWKSLGIYEMDAGISPGVLVDSQQRRGQHGSALQLRRRGAVRDQPLHASKIVFVQSNVPGTGYIAAGPAAIAKAVERPDHGADRERADHGRQLGRAQARRRGGLERVRWCSTSPRPRRW